MGWQRGGEERLPCTQTPGKSYQLFPLSFHPAQTSHMFLIFSLTQLPQTCRHWNQGRREVADKALYKKKKMGAKTGKSMKKWVKKQIRNLENKKWNLVVSNEGKWEEEHAGIPMLVCKHPWNPSSLLCTVDFCGSWHASSSGVYDDGAKPPTLLIDYRDITRYHKMAFLIYWLDLLLQRIPPTHTRYPKKNTDEVAKSSQLEGSCLCNHHAAYLAPTLQHSLRAWPTSISILLNAYDWSALENASCRKRGPSVKA